MVSEYVGKEVKVDLDNGLYYKGLVLSFGEDFLTMRDKNNKLVYISLKNVVSIREVSK